MDSMTKTGDLQIAGSKIEKLSAGTVLDIKSEIIVCTPYHCIAEYQGTRAALEAEGVIPTETKWPDTGFDRVHWSDDVIEYTLFRDRPDGATGAKKLFVDVDWWRFGFSPIRQKPYQQVDIEQKKKALEDAIFRQTTEGMHLIQKLFHDYHQSEKDAAYQKFRGCLTSTG